VVNMLLIGMKILIGTVIVASLPLIAIHQHLCFGWQARKGQIVSRLPDESISFYRATFCPKSNFSNSAGFAKEYDLRYGRKLFCFPVGLFAATLIFLACLAVSWVFLHGWSGENDGTARIAIFSLAGAYVWITYDLIIRARQNDIRPSNVNRATLRLLISLPFGLAISSVPTASWVAPGMSALAFFVGAFPTNTILKIMRRTARFGRLKLDASSTGNNVQQLLKIDGITVPIAERFIDEGVITNLQLAYADPVALTIKTGMDFSFILLCCAQALVRTYFNDDQIIVAHKFALRTGFEIKPLNDALLSYDKLIDEAEPGTAAPPRNTTQAMAQQLLESFATGLALDTASTRFILNQIAVDPYTMFIWQMWPDKPDPPQTDEPTQQVA
jgi:hypothetical protein